MWSKTKTRPRQHVQRPQKSSLGWPQDQEKVSVATSWIKCHFLVVSVMPCLWLRILTCQTRGSLPAIIIQVIGSRTEISSKLLMCFSSSLSVWRRTILFSRSHHPVCCCKRQSQSEICWVNDHRSATHAVINWRPLFCGGWPTCVEQATVTPLLWSGIYVAVILTF